MKNLFIALLLLTSCERNHASTNPTPPSGGLYQLYLFAAGFCGPCKEELPELQGWHDSFADKDRIITTVYFTAGNPASKPANQEDADAYRKDLNLSFPVIADRHAKIYRKYYTTGGAVPATVLLNGLGEVVKIFTPGKITGAELELWID